MENTRDEHFQTEFQRMRRHRRAIVLAEMRSREGGIVTLREHPPHPVAADPGFARGLADLADGQP